MQSNNLDFEKSILNIIQDYLKINGVFAFENSYQKFETFFVQKFISLNSKGRSELIQNNLTNIVTVKSHNIYTCRIEFIGNSSKYYMQKLKTMWGMPSVREKLSAVGIGYLDCINTIDLTNIVEFNYVQRIVSTLRFNVAFEDSESFNEIKEINLKMNNENYNWRKRNG